MILSALLTSVGINVGLCFLFLTLYSILRNRPHNTELYVPRLAAEGKVLEEGTSLKWVKRAWQVSEEELLENSGLDAVVFMRIFIFWLVNGCTVMINWSRKGYILLLFVIFCCGWGIRAGEKFYD